MKKIFFIIFIFFLNFGVLKADSGSSSVSWSANSGKTECGTSFSHGVTHYGVPNFNSSKIWESGYRSCITHTYSGNTYTRKISGEMTACDKGDRVFMDDRISYVEHCSERIEKVCNYTIRNGKCMQEKRIIMGHSIWRDMGFEYKKVKECKNIQVDNNINYKKDYITCEKYDDTPPSLSDITFNYDNNINVNSSNPNFLRAENHSITFTMKRNDNENSAYIKSIDSEVENAYNQNVYNSRNRSFGFFSGGRRKYKFTENFDFTKVDNFRNDKNFREYTYKINDICDRAGNCLSHTGSGPKIFNYNVYANYIEPSNSNITEPTFPEMADGKEKKFTFNLRDKFGNKILPVKSSSGNQVRKLTFDTNYNNNLHLNQYIKQGSGVYSSGFYNGNSGFFQSLNIGNNQNIRKDFSETSVKNGNYILSFKPYSPTYLAGATDGRQYVDGNFYLIGNTSVKLSDKGTQDNLLGPKELQFKPRFYTEITGDIVKNNLVVGSRENSEVKLKKNDAFATLNGNIFLEYGYIDETEPDEKLKHKKHNNFELNYLDGNIWRVVSSGFGNFTNFGNKTRGLITILYQKGKIKESETKTYLATQIREIIDGKESVYNSFVLGMEKYFGNLKNDKNTFQRPLKIIGNTHSLYYSETIEGDKGKNVSLLGNLEKTELQKYVRKNVLENLRNLKFKNIPSNITDLNLDIFKAGNYGIKIGDTIYFSNLKGKKVYISGTYSGIKNIVIYGGDAYINKDILSTNKNKDILSIIVVKDEKGNGGNILINHLVNRIEAIMYADKSLLSSNDGTNILSPKNGGTYDLLKNQLHIFGSIFSNNTIGGSTKPQPICPYYINKNICNIDEAQKYDLYNFRRGYENLYKDGEEVYKDDNLKDEYLNGTNPKDVKYPLIIEYNPLIQSKNLKFFQIKK